MSSPPGTRSLALVISSMSFVVPAVAAGGSWTRALMALLVVTSVLQHGSSVGEHPRLKWVDRIFAMTVGLGYVCAAVAAGRLFAASCGVASALLFALSKRRNMGTSWGIASHAAVHVVGALGVAAYLRTYPF